MAMVCPVDGNELKMSERQGVEIDYCPQCRGVWLDRGELDKILDRSEQALEPGDAEPARSYKRPSGYDAPGYGYSRGHDDDDDDHRRHGKKGRRGWLGEMFEFGD